MAQRKKKFNIEVGTSIIKNFSRMETRKTQLFCEFIDNSLQSFLDHKDILMNECNVRECKINITWSNDEIVIKDNAFGMEDEEFGRALRLNAPAKSYSKGSLSKYGMGLKYAAVNLGDWWSIQTTQFNSTNLFYGEIDVDDLTANNTKEIYCDIKDVSNESHYTIITIKKVATKYTNSDFEKLLKELGVVYESYISSRELNLSVNGVKVEYTEPEFRRDKQDSEYIYFFNDRSFRFEEKTYEYNGYVAILKKGNNDDAGLKLKQNKRVIALTYKPQALFGKGNDYRQQRIYGEVIFEGDNWVPRFDKDGLVWNGTGLEEKFIEDLLNTPGIKNILKISQKLRKEDNPMAKVTVKGKNANIIGIKSSYDYGSAVSFTVIPMPGFIIRNVKMNGKVLKHVDGRENSYKFIAEEDKIDVEVNAVADSNYVDPNLNNQHSDGTSHNSNSNSDQRHDSTINQPLVREFTFKEKIESDFIYLKNVRFPVVESSEGCVDNEGIVIKFLNEEFSFIVSFDNNLENADFIDLKEKQPAKNTYYLTINTNVPAFDNVSVTGSTKEVLTVMAISLALSRFKAEHLSVKKTDTKIIFDSFNDVMNRNGGQ